MTKRTAVASAVFHHEKIVDAEEGARGRAERRE